MKHPEVMRSLEITRLKRRNWYAGQVMGALVASVPMDCPLTDVMVDNLIDISFNIADKMAKRANRDDLS